MSRELSVKELAAELGHHPNTIRRWVREELIPFQRTPTGRLRFELSMVLKYYHQCTPKRTKRDNP